jgi:hypothetical protein
MMWANAYLEQARSDWVTRELIAQIPCATCHELHYLQMTTEKLGKAVLLRGKTTDMRGLGKTHHAFVRFLRLAARNHNLQRKLCMHGVQLQQYILGVLPIADQIEHLAPTLARDGPNPEYPWEIPSGGVIAPASYAFPVTGQLQEAQGRKLLRLISIILECFDTLF